jgi:hypothetical protein
VAKTPAPNSLLFQNCLRLATSSTAAANSCGAS